MDEPIAQIAEKLKAARLNSGLSLRELAEKADVSASFLSKLENEKLNPSVRTLYSIAEALSIPIYELFAESAPLTDSVQEKQLIDQMSTLTETELELDGVMVKRGVLPKGPVVYAGTGKQIKLMGGVQWELLTSANNKQVEFIKSVYNTGATSGDKMSHHHGREFHYVLQGNLTLSLGFDQYNLCAGDSITFSSQIPHLLINSGDEELHLLSVVFE